MKAVATEPRVEVDITETTYLIEGWATLPGHGGVRVAYAVRDQWGWAVMAKRGLHIVTVARADRSRTSVARARAVQLVAHQVDRWRRVAG